MTEDNIPSGEQAISELDMLKQRARMMGITHSNNIGVEALRAKVQAKMDGNTEEPEALSDDFNPLDPERVAPVNRDETKQEMRERLLKESMKLVRLRITNMDPKKRDLPGEIFTVGNEFIGTVRKYIPYGEITDIGYHVPWIIYQEMDSRRFLNVRTSQKKGQIVVSDAWAKEFALEVLPVLTPEELATLAAGQAAGRSITD